MRYQRILAITINPGLAIVGVLPSVSLGESYSASLRGYGGIEPYQWAMVGGYLPSGLAFGVDSGGDYVLSGTTSEVGDFLFTVLLRDSSGKSTTRAFRLRVVAQPLTIDGNAPGATAGVPYSYTYSASGGVGPYTFAVTMGSIPPGLTLNPSTGEISGTPTSGGNYSFAVGVTDSQLPPAEAWTEDGISVTTIPLDVTGSVADTTIGYPLRGGVFEITGGVAPYSLSGTPYSGTRPAGVSVAIVGDELQMTGNTTTLDSYSWTERVLSTDGQHFDVVCSVQVRAAWTPANLATPPSIWVNDTSSVTNVSGACSQWNDISGNGYNFVQTTAGNRPAITASAQNGLRGITFDGTNDQMATSAGSATRGIFTNVAAGWMMYVGRKTGTDGAGTIRYAVHVPSGAGAGTTRAALAMGSAATANVPRVFGRRLDADANTSVPSSNGVRTNWLTSIGTMDYANRTLTIYVDGSQVGQDTTMSASGGNTSNTQSFTELTLSGNNPGSPTAGASDMVLGEVIIGGGYLPTATEIEKLAGWAAWKWALTTNLEPTNPWHDIPPYV